nr:ABC transporter permease [Pseudomonas aeruginosa]
MSSALSIRQLTKTYGNGFQALKGIDLDVAEGDFFALLGPNGAGKSTTIGILSTLVNKTSGSVSVFGHDLDKDPAGLKRCLGVVPQEFNFNQFEKVFDIVVTQAGYYGIPAKIAKERAERYLTQLGLWDKRNEASRMLSGGMKRRLMIARALVHQPRLLILDEPTAGVDIELRRSMWSFLTELNQEGISIILTTHYLEEAEQLVLYFVIFGNLIGRQIGDMGGFTYMEYIVPGLIMMSVITNAYGNVVSSFFGSKFQRSVEELLVSPVSPHTILLGYTIGGVLRGLAVGVIVTMLSLFFTKLQVHHLGITVLVVVLTATIFSLGGFINAVFARNFDDISIIPTFVLTPLTYLGGVFYSINLLPPFWQTVSLANPILHMVNAFRYGILGVSDIRIGVAIGFMLLATAVLYLGCVRLLVSGRGMRQ